MYCKADGNELDNCLTEQRGRRSTEGENMGESIINFEEELNRFKPSLDVEEIADEIVKSDLTDMTDIMMEMIKEVRE